MPLDKNSIFFDRIFLLTKKKISKKINPIIDIPDKYYPLFENTRKRLRMPLHEIADFVDDILSRKEEYRNTNLDKHGRFNRNKSLLVRKSLDQSPVIDELIADIINQLRLEIRDIWPFPRKTTVCLTHDVDAFDGTSYLWLRKTFWLSKSFLSFCKLRINESRKWLQKIKKWHNIKKDPIFAFDRWMELEAKHGFRSTFFFLSLKRTLSREGRRYSYRNPKVGEVIKELNEGAWEIGLHAAYHNHLNLDYIKKQKGRLEDISEKEIIGCRHHYLRIKLPESWVLYEKAGFKYSSNMGWGSDSNGFRAGTCLPFKPIRTYEKTNFWEIPFQIMDNPTIENVDSYIKLFADYLEKVKRVNGCLVLNFHQESLNEDEVPAVKTAYKEILNTLANDKEIWVAKLSEVYKHLNAF